LNDPADQRQEGQAKIHQASYTADYLAEAARICAALDPAQIDAMIRLLCGVRDNGGRLFCLGAGGGASHASHAVNDLRKVAGMEAYSPADNIAELTARINDDGWETAYARWLEVSRLSSKDAVFVFSVGGGDVERAISISIVEGLKLAKRVGAKIAGIVGRDGGYTAQVGDAVVLVPTRQPEMITAQVESFQSVIWHAIISHPDLRVNEMKWESER
jgi:D-sedoheptulose 7-phosphate isomerase